MKKIFALIMAVIMLVTVLAACGGGGTTAPATQGQAPAATTDDSTDTAAPAVDDTPREGGTINIWSFTDEIPKAAQRFREMNPDFPYDINVTVIPQMVADISNHLIRHCFMVAHQMHRISTQQKPHLFSSTRK